MPFTKIEAKDYDGKGVTGLPDIPRLDTLDMQKKFDELATDIIIPKFNQLIDALAKSDAASLIGATAPSGITAENNIQSILAAIAVICIAANNKKHSHANKLILDNISQDSVSSWDAVVTLLSGINGVINSVVSDETKLVTGKAVSDYVQQMGGGDMVRAVYDKNADGIVDDSEKLGGNLPSYFQGVSDAALKTAAKTIVGAINELFDRTPEVLDTLEEIDANTLPGLPAGSLAVKELNGNFAYDENGDLVGYYKKSEGADTVYPFSSGVKGLEVFSVTATRFTSVGTKTLTVDVPAGESLIVATVSSYDEGKDIPTCDDLEVAYLYGVKFSNEYSIAVFLCNKETSGSVTITETSTKGYNVTGAVVLYVTDRAEPSTETRSYFGFLYGGPQSRAYFAIGNATKADITVTNGQPIMVTNEVNDNSGYDGTKIATGTGTTQTVDLSAYKDSYSYLGVGGIGGAYTVTLY